MLNEKLAWREVDGDYEDKSSTPLGSLMKESSTIVTLQPTPKNLFGS
jgi:hypothetical protein